MRRNRFGKTGMWDGVKTGCNEIVTTSIETFEFHEDEKAARMIAMIMTDG